MYKYIKLFIGLGNPDRIYQQTRHNYGTIVLNAIAKSISLDFKICYNKQIAYFDYCNSFKQPIWILKPLVSMNLCGAPIYMFMRNHNILPEEIFVFYDDCSILLGKYKIKMAGASGGHNGINSLIKCINSCHFARMKLGIGPLTQGLSMANFVLTQFTNCDQKNVNFIKKVSIMLFHEINLIGLEKAISNISQKKLI
jgi:PTH1 family peptidyl-tRNA hydrolase